MLVISTELSSLFHLLLLFFFFKQKTAYEMLRSLVGSEMCIRDREKKTEIHFISKRKARWLALLTRAPLFKNLLRTIPVSYTHLTLPTIYSV